MARPAAAPTAGEVTAAAADTAATIEHLVAGARADLAAAVIEAGRAEALALAVLDAAAHLRRMSTLSIAAIAAGLDKILTGQAEAGEATIAATEKSLDLATARLRQLVELAGAAAEPDR